jgi:hypothetical protein
MRDNHSLSGVPLHFLVPATPSRPGAVVAGKNTRRAGMSGNEQLRLLILQEETERLRDLLDQLPDDPVVSPMLQLLRDAEKALQASQRLGRATGRLDEPLPWWGTWQRQHGTGGAAAPGATGPGAGRRPPAGAPDDARITRAERQIREGEARVARQRTLLARITLQEDPRELEQAETLLQNLMRAQLLAQARLLILRHLRSGRPS